ncbi:MAG: hypothetical protein DCF22_15025, partial [Leptolyngbya sp.]
MTTSELSGLMGWWPLGDGDGKVSDRLGQSNGVVTGAERRTHLQGDRLGPSRSLFFPRGAYAAIPDAPNVGTGDFSICLWAKTSGYLRDTEVLLDKRMETSGPVRGWSLFLYNGQLGFQIADGNWLNFLLVTSGRQAPVDGNWHHLAITINRDQAAGGRWYIDGQAVGSPFSVTHHAGSLSNEFPLTLGRRSDADGGFFGGELSDVRLYERALTAEEIYQVYGSIAADEQASRVLVTPPPGVRTAARSIKTSEPLPLPDGVPLMATRLEPDGEALPEMTQPEPMSDEPLLLPEAVPRIETLPEPAVAALPEAMQPVQMDAEATLAFERVRQKILNSLSAERLELPHNELTHLPPEIGQLHNLQSLVLQQNKLTHLPPEIGQLHNLQSLALRSYQLTHLPPEIGQLHNLQSLALRSSKLTHLPPEIGQLHNLIRLVLQQNKLTHLPPEIGQLHNLQSLDLSHNKLTRLPPEIGQLHKLQSLDLWSNKLTHLPPEIGQLHNLQSLDLHENQLTHLPPEIGQLHNLPS